MWCHWCVPSCYGKFWYGMLEVESDCSGKRVRIGILLQFQCLITIYKCLMTFEDHFHFVHNHWCMCKEEWEWEHKGKCFHHFDFAISSRSAEWEHIQNVFYFIDEITCKRWRNNDTFCYLLFDGIHYVLLVSITIFLSQRSVTSSQSAPTFSKCYFII